MLEVCSCWQRTFLTFLHTTRLYKWEMLWLHGWPLALAGTLSGWAHCVWPRCCGQDVAAGTWSMHSGII